MKKRADISVIVMVVVVIAVAVLGAFAIAPTIKDSMANKDAQKLAERMQNGTATVSDMANSAGMKYDEFIAQYDLKPEDIDENADMNAFAEKLSLKHYCEFAGLTYTDEALEAYKKENEDAKDLTADTTDMDAKVAFAQHLYQIEQAAQAAQAAEAPAEESESQETHSDAE